MAKSAANYALCECALKCFPFRLHQCDQMFLVNGPPRLSVCHQRAVHKRKIS